MTVRHSYSFPEFRCFLNSLTPIVITSIPVSQYALPAFRLSRIPLPSRPQSGNSRSSLFRCFIPHDSTGVFTSGMSIRPVNRASTFHQAGDIHLDECTSGGLPDPTGDLTSGILTVHQVAYIHMSNFTSSVLVFSQFRNPHRHYYSGISTAPPKVLVCSDFSTL